MTSRNKREGHYVGHTTGVPFEIWRHFRNNLRSTRLIIATAQRSKVTRKVCMESAWAASHAQYDKRGAKAFKPRWPKSKSKNKDQP